MSTTTAPAQAAAPSADVTIGRNIDYLIWRSRETRAALAKELGITAGSLSHKLRGRRPWTATEIFTVSRHYRVSIDSLFKQLPEMASMPLGGPSDYKATVPPRPMHHRPTVRPGGRHDTRRPTRPRRHPRRRH